MFVFLSLSWKSLRKVWSYFFDLDSMYLGSHRSLYSITYPEIVSWARYVPDFLQLFFYEHIRLEKASWACECISAQHCTTASAWAVIGNSKTRCPETVAPARDGWRLFMLQYNEYTCVYLETPARNSFYINIRQHLAMETIHILAPALCTVWSSESISAGGDTQCARQRRRIHLVAGRERERKCQRAAPCHSQLLLPPNRSPPPSPAALRSPSWHCCALPLPFPPLLSVGSAGSGEWQQQQRQQRHRHWRNEDDIVRQSLAVDCRGETVQFFVAVSGVLTDETDIVKWCRPLNEVTHCVVLVNSSEVSELLALVIVFWSKILGPVRSPKRQWKVKVFKCGEVLCGLVREPCVD